MKKKDYLNVCNFFSVCLISKSKIICCAVNVALKPDCKYIYIENESFEVIL